MEISIRPLHKHDAEAYRALRLESFLESPYAFSESYEDEVHKTAEDFAADFSREHPEEHFVLGAFLKLDELAGIVTFTRDRRTKARHKSMIFAMYTKENVRGSGIGKALLNAVISRAQALKGLEQIHLWVLHSSSSAADFYRKSGFQTQGALVKNDLKINGRYVDAEYMVRYLKD